MYRLQALSLGLLFILAGTSVLVYLIAQAGTFTSVVQGSIIAFVALGLLLIGTLTTFAAPEPLVVSEIVSRAVSPSAENLALILDSILPKCRALHVPRATLGGVSQVLLVLWKGANMPIIGSGGFEKEISLTWSSNSKVLEPVGNSLLKGYEKAIKRDFLELDIQQLARFLNKAIVPELQLASGFSFRELSASRYEAVWTKATVVHTCLSKESSNHPELCCLCSSVACALAKARGRAVWIESSISNDAGLQVTTTYRVYEKTG